MDTNTVRFVLVRQGEHRWKQILGIADGRVYLFELKPNGNGGWQYEKLTVQDKESWPNMDANAIYAWKQKNASPLESYVDPKPSDLEWLRERLTRVDAVLSLR